MPRVLPHHIAAATAKAAKMSLAEKEAEFDIIYHEQPNLLASVIVQQQIGNTLEQMDVLLDLLLAVHIALNEAGVALETVTEELQERELRRLHGQILFTDGLDSQLLGTAVQDLIDNHPEKWLFALAVGEITKAGFPMLEKESAKYLISCALNMVQCIAVVEERK